MRSFLIDGYDWERTRLGRFVQRYGYESIASLQSESVHNPDPFWEALVSEIDLTWLSPYTRVVETRRDASVPEWFCDGRLNISLDAVDKWAAREPAREAIRWEGENGSTRTLNCAQLAGEVARVAAGLAHLNVARGDRVAICLSMVPEMVVTLLAVARIGAVAVPLPVDLDAAALALRITNCGAAVLFCADGMLRDGCVMHTLEHARRITAIANCVSAMVVVPRLARDGIDTAGAPARGAVAPEFPYDDLGHADATPSGAVPMAPSEPLLLLYSDEPQGMPSSALHTHLGFYIKACQDLMMSLDAHPGDTLLWMSAAHQIMGPILALGALSLGLNLVLVEGGPEHPRADRLWTLVERHQVTHLGLDPDWVDSLMHAEQGFPWQGRLGSVRLVGSAGSALKELPWWWLFQRLGGGKRPVVSLAGGTGILGGVFGCFPGLPLKPAAFSGPLPGIAAQVRDQRDRPLIGHPGRLVIDKPWPWLSSGSWPGAGQRRNPAHVRRTGVWKFNGQMVVDADGFWFECRSDTEICVTRAPAA